MFVRQISQFRRRYFSRVQYKRSALLDRMSASALHVCLSDSVAPLISGPSDPTYPRCIRVDCYSCCFPRPRSHQVSTRFRATAQVLLSGALEYLQKRFRGPDIGYLHTPEAGHVVHHMPAHAVDCIRSKDSEIGPNARDCVATRIDHIQIRARKGDNAFVGNI